MLPGEREASVHMALFPTELDQWKDAALVERWAPLLHARDVVNLTLEEKRSAKVISSNLSAKVKLFADERAHASLLPYEEFLPALFGVSKVVLVNTGTETNPTGESFDDRSGWKSAEVERADGTKCERCWRYVPEVSQEDGRTGLCPRCVEALAEPVSL
jgi:isoleucyl-tRNA synthetase